MPKSILDRSFRYTPAASTDISLTFKRVRRQLKQEAEAEQRRGAEQQRKVAAISGRRKPS